MQAVYIDQPGPPEVLKYGELPDPKPTGSEVLVRVEAVCVNPIDTYIRSGAVAMPLPKPYIPGCDVAGVVEALGPEATRCKVGDRVWGSNQGLLGRQGTFAELACVEERWLYPIPPFVFFQEAAAVALVGITAHLGLFRAAKLQKGETVFVNGGTGGVGSSVVQMAVAVGARVLTTAGSDPKVARCRAIGADRAVNYKTQDVDQAIREFAPQGVDLWWETLREPNFERAIGHLGRRGRMIVMAGREARPVFPVGPFYTKDCSIHGFAMFNASPEEQELAAADINRWLADGKLRAGIDRILPLSRTIDAHRLQEQNTLHLAGTLMGKIILKPDSRLKR